MVMTKNFGLAGVASQFQVGKSGGQIAWDQASSSFKFTTKDGSTLAPLQVALAPDSPNAVASKWYVDSVATGLDVKQSVRVMSLSNLTLSGLQTVDGVTLSVGDRILIAGQTDAKTNGIYVVSNGVWQRADDADGNPNQEVSSGMFTFVEEGSHAKEGWVLASKNNTTVNGFACIDLGNTDLTFTQFTGAGQLTAGNGVSLNGGQINAVGTAGRIVSTPTGLDIASDYVGQTSITTLGTISTGTWHGSTVTEAFGGTGKTSYAAGDLLVGNTTNGLDKLSKGASKQFLRVKADGSALEYANLIAGDVAFTATGFTSTDVAAAIVEASTKAGASSTALQSELDNTQAKIGLDNSGNLVAWTSSNYIGSTTTVVGAVNALDTQVKANADAVAAETTARAAAVTAEATARGLADAAIQAELDASQAAAGLKADGTLDVWASTNFLSTSEITLKSGIEKLDAQLKATKDALNSEIDSIEASIGLNADGTLVAFTGNYTTGKTTVKAAIDAIDTQVKANADAVAQEILDRAAAVTAEASARAAADTAIQSELDTTQAGAGLEATGAYVADSSTNYIKTATSLKDADKKLDAQIKSNADNIASEISNRTTATNAIQTELDATQAGAGLGTNGAYTPDATTNYIKSALTLKDADKLLDAQIKTNADNIAAEGTNRATAINAVQTEVDAIEVGAGLEINGNYVADTATNYLKTATSLKNADKLLDTELKRVADIVDANGASVGTELGNVKTAVGLNSNGTFKTITGNYTGSATTVAGAIQALDTQAKANADADAAEVIARTNADAAIQSELDTTQVGAGLGTDGTYAADSSTNYIKTATSLKNADKLLDTQVKANADAITAEAAARTAADTAIKTAAGLAADGTYVANTGVAYIGSATSLSDADKKLDAQIKANTDAIAALDHTRIYDAAGTTWVDVDSASGKVQVEAAGKLVTEFAAGTSTGGEHIVVRNGDAGKNEVRFEATNTAAAGDVDIRFVPQGNGQVYIGDSGDGLIQADDNSKLTLKGGNGTTGAGADLVLEGGNGTGTYANGNVVLRAGNGGTGSAGAVRVQDGAAADIVKFAGVANAVDYFVFTSAAANGILDIAAAGSDTNVDIMLSPKGNGQLLVPSGYQVTDNASVATKAYVDNAILTNTDTLTLRAVVAANGTAKSFAVGTVPSVTGKHYYVSKVTINVTAAFSTDTGANLKADTNVVASNSEFDLTTTGVYVIDGDFATDVKGLAVALGGFTTAPANGGSAIVTVEYKSF